jgi:hypothetical protein
MFRRQRRSDRAAVNPMSYAGKPVVLDVVRTERKTFFGLIEDPKNWKVQTRFPGGAARGDPAVIDQVRKLFFAI